MIRVIVAVTRVKLRIAHGGVSGRDQAARERARTATELDAPHRVDERGLADVWNANDHHAQRRVARVRSRTGRIDGRSDQLVHGPVAHGACAEQDNVFIAASAQLVHNALHAPQREVHSAARSYAPVGPAAPAHPVQAGIDEIRLVESEHARFQRRHAAQQRVAPVKGNLAPAPAAVSGPVHALDTANVGSDGSGQWYG